MINLNAGVHSADILNQIFRNKITNGVTQCKQFAQFAWRARQYPVGTLSYFDISAGAGTKHLAFKRVYCFRNEIRARPEKS